MDLNIVSNSVQTITAYAAGISTAYVLTLGTLNLIASNRSRQIGNQGELEDVLAQENVEGHDVIPVFNWENSAEQKEDGSYELSATSEYLVRHELQHIRDGHLANGQFMRRKGLRQLVDVAAYLLYYEPRATLASLKSHKYLQNSSTLT